MFRRNDHLLYPNETQPLHWRLSDEIVGGFWEAECSLNKADFKKNDDVILNIQLKINSKEFNEYIKDYDGIGVIIVAERINNKDGRPNLITNNFMSTVLTPTGMPIEFLFEPTKSYYPEDRLYQSILELDNFKKKEQINFTGETIQVNYILNKKIPVDFPEGYYRFHLDFYTMIKHDSERSILDTDMVTKLKNHRERLSLVSFLGRGGKQRNKAIFHRQSHFIQRVYPSPVFIVGNPATPRMIWALFIDQIFMGTKGIIAEEDKEYFRLNPRHRIPDKFIIPPGTELNIEPDFPIFFIDKTDTSITEKNWPFCIPIPLDYKSGEFSISIISPDGTEKNLGKSRFLRPTLTGASSGTNRYRFKFSNFGQYVIKVDGWIKDLWGHKYEGGGTYYLWVAHRLSFATSVKPGLPFEIGDSYPTSVFVHPPFPAAITIDITEYINSQQDKVKNWHIDERASRFGYAYSKEKVTFQEPGEYIARVNAVYKSPDGRLWMGNQVGSSVIAPVENQLDVQGKQYCRPKGIPRERFNLNTEGCAERDGINICETFDYSPCVNMSVPYNSGDVMFIAATADSSNGIDGILSAHYPYGPYLKTETENHVYPYDFPEKIKKHAYFYFSAIRPGLIARSFVADPASEFNDSYWETNPAFKDFGRQFNVGEDDDLPQDIYRFMGGFVFRDLEKNKADYGIYSSVGIVVPKGSNNNRVVAPFSEPLLEVNGRPFYIFEVGAPSQGTIFEVNEPMGIGGMVFPAVGGINCIKKIVFPDGREVITQGVSNKIGTLKMSPEKVIADIPGVYKIIESCRYGEYSGDVVGTADGTYNIYVDDKNRRKFFRFKNPKRFVFDPVKGLELKGILRGDLADVKLTYSVIMPGCVMDEGTLKVEEGKFSYKFRPEEFNAQFPNYNFIRKTKDGRLLSDEKPFFKKYFLPKRNRVVDLVMMTFFLEGKDRSKDNNVYDVITVMLRGDKVYICEYE
ncbi:MAG: hypothetical protein Q8N62_01165 [Candidatus Omnitrophota bacterium]|nr:hypothetical protein [Candidatus Omnitrophota bacterium]